MNTQHLLSVKAVITDNAAAISANGEVSYIIGAIAAGFILAYLIYSLLKPEKF
jgi:K+-transporting ATPase KdpF subunit